MYRGRKARQGNLKDPRLFHIIFVLLPPSTLRTNEGGTRRRRHEFSALRFSFCFFFREKASVATSAQSEENKHRKDRNSFSELFGPPDESLKIYPKFHVRPIFARTERLRTGYRSAEAGCTGFELATETSLRSVGHVDFYCWKEAHPLTLPLILSFPLFLFSGVLRGSAPPRGLFVRRGKCDAVTVFWKGRVILFDTRLTRVQVNSGDANRME